MLLFLTSWLALAAEPDPATGDRETPARWSLSAGWFGHLLTHPGAFFGVEWLGLQGQHHALILGGRSGLYLHPGHHVGLWLRPEVGWRGTTEIGLYGEVLVGIGAHHGWLAGPLYVEREGELRRSIDAGRTSAMPGGAVGAGWDLSRRGERDLRLFGRLDVWARAPVNATAIPGAAVSFGAAWTVR